MPRGKTTSFLRGLAGNTGSSAGRPKSPPVRTFPQPSMENLTGGNGGTYFKPTSRTCFRTSRRKRKKFTTFCGRSSRHMQKPNRCPPVTRTLLRDLLAGIPNRKAAGPDGAPSQLLKWFLFKQITSIADLFTTLSRTIDYNHPSRPEQWDHAIAIMIPKGQHPTTLDKHRTISLMNQLHKFFTKWLLLLSTPTLDTLLSEHQLGFRRHRQASEALFTIHRLTELAMEWEQPMTIMRLDISKAFDRMRQSAILPMLYESPLHKSLAFNLTRELIGTYIHPQLYSTTTEDPIPLARGSKQGAPESGLLFISTMNWALAPSPPKVGAKRVRHPHQHPYSYPHHLR